MTHLFIEYPTSKQLDDVGRRTLRFYIHIGEFAEQSLIFERIPNNNVYIYYGEDAQLLKFTHDGFEDELKYENCVKHLLAKIKSNPKIPQEMKIHFLIIP